jgi:hypothetical protein
LPPLDPIIRQNGYINLIVKTVSSTEGSQAGIIKTKIPVVAIINVVYASRERY